MSKSPASSRGPGFFYPFEVCEPAHWRRRLYRTLLKEGERLVTNDRERHLARRFDDQKSKVAYVSKARKTRPASWTRERKLKRQFSNSVRTPLYLNDKHRTIALSIGWPTEGEKDMDQKRT